MTDEKGLSPEVADRIGEYVKLKGQFVPLSTLIAISNNQHPKQEGLPY
jgi:hypothetical protein